MLGLQKLIESHPFQKFLICFELTDDYLLNGLSEAYSVDDPKSALFYSCGCGGSLDLIQKGQFSEPLTSFEYFGGFFLNFDFYWALLYNIEAGADGALSEDDGCFVHFCPKHVFLDVI